MFDLEKYNKILSILETEVKDNDSLTAHNVAKEVSVIYLKYTYSIPQPGIVARIDSLIDYISKAIPDCDRLLSELSEVRLHFTRLIAK